MSDRPDLLIEIGTEELPPGALQTLSSALCKELAAALEAAQLLANDSQAERFATPRRLAVRISKVAPRQADREEQRLGPAVAAAFDKNGKPTPAANGFARSCGVEVDQLQRVETDKGERLGVVRQVEGAALADLLPEMLARCCAALPVPRPMRWGDSDATFVRPVHWLVALHGDAVVPGELFGQNFGRTTRGHRFHHPDPIELATPGDYESALEQAFVLADTARRRERIVDQANALVSGGQQVLMEPAVLDEVVNLCEWPVALVGDFDPGFLAVPAEALRSSMEMHQRFFPVTDGVGELAPRFVAVANLESLDPQQVRSGFERVITPRLADARFFWNQDQKTPLVERRPALDRVIYQKQLGSLGDKVERVAALATALAGKLGVDQAAVHTAAQLCKTDLLTDMVGEFPDLQGIMGRYYASEQGHPAEVCQAIEDHYLPRHAGDRLPGGGVGQVLALADRLDSLCGIFAVGLKPSGNRDPFALRRGALGLLRILIECELDLDLVPWLQAGLDGVAAQVTVDEAIAEELLEFVMDRLRAYYADLGIDGDVFEAVWARRPTRPLDFHQRVQGLVAFRELQAAAALAAANKRIGNLLRKAGLENDRSADSSVAPELFSEAAEGALHEALAAASQAAAPLAAGRDYRAALERLADLREPVDTYFDQVMVMTDNAAEKNNRLALLADVKAIFDEIADISRLRVSS